MAHTRTSGKLFEPGAPFTLSRSKLELFINCPRCFYFDRRLGVAQVPGFPFTLNNAVDALLKKEFDIHRAAGSVHPLLRAYGVTARPFMHEKIDAWRDTRRGISYFHEPTQLTIFGAIDDVWINDAGELIVVDYKATSTTAPLTLDADYRQAYKRQIEIYQWLFRRNGFAVSPTGYFVYANGKKDRAAFDGVLEFDVLLLPYAGNDDWVERVVVRAHQCLAEEYPPVAAKACPWCAYRAQASLYES
ncbi:MAG: PD-(D/E)XK nuclease family protein [Candidatus Paceibacterota bacterium]|jgi:hypothetical protein